MVPEFLARMHVGDMDLDRQRIDALDRVAQGYRGMGIGARIDDDAGTGQARLLDEGDELTLEIGLAEGEVDARGLSLAAQAFLDAGQGDRTIGSGLAGSEQVEIGSVQDVDGDHRKR